MYNYSVISVKSLKWWEDFIQTLQPVLVKTDSTANWASHVHFIIAIDFPHNHLHETHLLLLKKMHSTTARQYGDYNCIDT